MLVKVRQGYTLKMDGEAYVENTILDVPEDVYKDKQHILDKLVIKSDAEKLFYDKKLRELAEGKKAATTTKVLVQVRGGYSYVDSMSKKLYPSGSKVEIPEKDYFERYWIFEPLEPAKKEKESEKKVIDGQEVGMTVFVSNVPKDKEEEDKKKEEEEKKKKEEEDKKKEEEEKKKKEEEDKKKEEEEKKKKEEEDKKVMTASTNRAILNRPSRIPKTNKKGKG